MKWEPISTAPRDALLLIANSGWGADAIMIACRRDYSESGWVDQRAVPVPVSWKPTHWAKMPEPPGKQAKKEDHDWEDHCGDLDCEICAPRF